MIERPTPSERLRITRIVDKHCAKLMEELEELHSEYGYPNEIIIGSLRHEGYGYEARLYREWISRTGTPE